MTNVWPRVPLEQVIHQHKEFIKIDDLKTYKRCRVQLHAQGIVLRDAVSGSEIKTKEQQVCRAGEFLVAEIDAKVGGFGIVPQELDGAIVSSHYFLFVLDVDVLNERFLDYYVRTATFRDQVFARGSTNYAAIRPNDVLGYEIPLPPLNEQRRIVARIEALATKIEEARGLRQSTEVSIRGLLLGACAGIIKDAVYLPMREVAPITRRPVKVNIDGNYLELGVRSFGKGTFHKPALDGGSVGSKKLFRMEPGDLVFNNVFAWEGAVAVVKPEDQGRVGSHRFIACVPKNGVAMSEFLCFHFSTKRGLEQLGDASPGGAGRNRTLGLEALEDIRVPVPPIEKQCWFTGLLAKADALKQLQAQTQRELDALLPSVLDRAFKGEL